MAEVDGVLNGCEDDPTAAVAALMGLASTPARLTGLDGVHKLVQCHQADARVAAAAAAVVAAYPLKQRTQAGGKLVDLCVALLKFHPARGNVAEPVLQKLVDEAESLATVFRQHDLVLLLLRLLSAQGTAASMVVHELSIRLLKFVLADEETDSSRLEAASTVSVRGICKTLGRAVDSPVLLRDVLWVLGMLGSYPNGAQAIVADASCMQSVSELLAAIITDVSSKEMAAWVLRNVSSHVPEPFVQANCAIDSVLLALQGVHTSELLRTHCLWTLYYCADVVVQSSLGVLVFGSVMQIVADPAATHPELEVATWVVRSLTSSSADYCNAQHCEWLMWLSSSRWEQDQIVENSIVCLGLASSQPEIRSHVLVHDAFFPLCCGVLQKQNVAKSGAWLLYKLSSSKDGADAVIAREDIVQVVAECMASTESEVRYYASLIALNMVCNDVSSDNLGTLLYAAVLDCTRPDTMCGTILRGLAESCSMLNDLLCPVLLPAMAQLFPETTETFHTDLFLSVATLAVSQPEDVVDGLLQESCEFVLRNILWICADVAYWDPAPRFDAAMLTLRNLSKHDSTLSWLQMAGLANIPPLVLSKYAEDAAAVPVSSVLHALWIITRLPLVAEDQAEHQTVLQVCKTLCEQVDDAPEPTTQFLIAMFRTTDYLSVPTKVTIAAECMGQLCFHASAERVLDLWYVFTMVAQNLDHVEEPWSAAEWLVAAQNVAVKSYVAQPPTAELIQLNASAIDATAAILAQVQEIPDVTTFVVAATDLIWSSLASPHEPVQISACKALTLLASGSSLERGLNRTFISTLCQFSRNSAASQDLRQCSLQAMAALLQNPKHNPLEFDPCIALGGLFDGSDPSISDAVLDEACRVLKVLSPSFPAIAAQCSSTVSRLLRELSSAQDARSRTASAPLVHGLRLAANIPGGFHSNDLRLWCDTIAELAGHTQQFEIIEHTLSVIAGLAETRASEILGASGAGVFLGLCNHLQPRVQQGALRVLVQLVKNSSTLVINRAIAPASVIPVQTIISDGESYGDAPELAAEFLSMMMDRNPRTLDMLLADSLWPSQCCMLLMHRITQGGAAPALASLVLRCAMASKRWRANILPSYLICQTAIAHSRVAGFTAEWLRIITEFVNDDDMLLESEHLWKLVCAALTTTTDTCQLLAAQLATSVCNSGPQSGCDQVYREGLRVCVLQDVQAADPNLIALIEAVIAVAGKPERHSILCEDAEMLEWLRKMLVDASLKPALAQVCVRAAGSIGLCTAAGAPCASLVAATLGCVFARETNAAVVSAAMQACCNFAAANAAVIAPADARRLIGIAAKFTSHQDIVQKAVQLTIHCGPSEPALRLLCHVLSSANFTSADQLVLLEQSLAMLIKVSSTSSGCNSLMACRALNSLAALFDACAQVPMRHAQAQHMAKVIVFAFALLLHMAKFALSGSVSVIDQVGPSALRCIIAWHMDPIVACAASEWITNVSQLIGNLQALDESVQQQLHSASKALAVLQP